MQRIVIICYSLSKYFFYYVVFSFFVRILVKFIAPQDRKIECMAGQDNGAYGRTGRWSVCQDRTNECMLGQDGQDNIYDCLGLDQITIGLTFLPWNKTYQPVKPAKLEVLSTVGRRNKEYTCMCAFTSQEEIQAIFLTFHLQYSQFNKIRYFPNQNLYTCKLDYEQRQGHIFF